MVEGARHWAKEHRLYFLTITCKGKQPLQDAEETYLENTNALFSSMRYQCKQNKVPFAYAAVTERQPKRQHPHSHVLTTFCPKDAFYVVDDYDRYCREVKKLNKWLPDEMRYTPEALDTFSETDMFSSWLCRAAVKSDLGVQCRLSSVESVEACSRYIAKYLFKASTRDRWPKGWKRVRYSQNWPKLKQDEGEKRAYVVLSAWDWHKVATEAGIIETFEPAVYERALLWECLNVVCKVENEIDLKRSSRHVLDALPEVR